MARTASQSYFVSFLQLPLTNRSLVRFRKGQFEESLEDADRAIALDTTWSKVRAGRIILVAEFRLFVFLPVLTLLFLALIVELSAGSCAPGAGTSVARAVARSSEKL